MPIEGRFYLLCCDFYRSCHALGRHCHRALMYCHGSNGGRQEGSHTACMGSESTTIPRIVSFMIYSPLSCMLAPRVCQVNGVAT